MTALSGFLPPLVQKIVSDGSQFITEQGRVMASMDATAQAAVAAAEREAQAARLAASSATVAADKQVLAAETAAKAASVAAAKTVEAQARAATATGEAQARAAAAAELAGAREAEAANKAATAVQLAADRQVAAQDAIRLADEKTAAAATLSASTGSSRVGAKVASGVQKGGLMAGGAAIAVGLGAVDMAVKFQTATTKLVTSAGESETAIEGVRAGLLRLTGDVGVSAGQLATDMYKIGSAGYHGAEGLGVLKAAEQGAKAEGADGAKVADALSSALRDYYPHATGAAEVTAAATDTMSKFIGATSAGKMTFDDLAGSLNSILPVASAAKISLSDVMGVLASMTVHGISADQATQNMADAIRHLQAPTQTMAKAMATLGVDSTDVAAKLGERGLSGTMQFLSEKVKSAMPPGSEKVFLDLGNALSKSTPKVQELGQKLMDGTITMKGFTQAIKAMDPISAGQAQQFATLAKSTHQIGNQMISGSEVLQTYGGTMAKVMGSATGLKVALMTTGENAKYTSDAIKSVSSSTADAAGNVKGWSEVQKNAGLSLAQLQASIGSMAVEIGTALLPMVKSAADAMKGFVDWATSNPAMFQAMAIGVLAVGAAFGVLAVSMMVASATPVAWIMAGIVVAVVALGMALGWLVIHWNDIVSVITQVWGGFVNWLIQIVGGLVNWWNGVWAGFTARIAVVWAGIWATITSIIRGGVAVVSSVISGFLGFVGAIWNGFWNGPFGQLIVAVFNLIVTVIQVALAWIGVGIRTAVDFIGGVWNAAWSGISSFFMGIWDGIVGFTSGAINGLVSAISGPLSAVAAFVSGVLNQIGGFFSDTWNQVTSTVSGAWASITSGVSGGVANVVSIVSGLGGQILGALGGIVGDALNAGANIVNAIANGITSAIGSVTHSIQAVTATIASFLPHSPAKQGPLSGQGYSLYSGRKLVSDLAVGMSQGIGSVSDAAYAVAGAGSAYLPDGRYTRSAAPGGSYPGAGGYGDHPPGGGTHITVNARTDASAAQIAREVGYQLLLKG